MVTKEQCVMEAERFVKWAWQKNGRIEEMVVFAPYQEEIALVGLAGDSGELAKKLAVLRHTLPFFVVVLEMWEKTFKENEVPRIIGRIKDMPDREEAVVMLVWDREKGRHQLRHRLISRVPGVEQGFLAATWTEAEGEDIKEEGRFCAGSHTIARAN